MHVIGSISLPPLKGGSDLGPRCSNNVTLDVLSTCDMFLCNNIGGGSRRLPPLLGGWGVGGP